MKTLNVIILCVIGAIALILAATNKSMLTSKEAFIDQYTTTSPGNTLVASSPSLYTAASQAASLMSFVPDITSTYNPTKTIIVFPTPSQTWLIDYQTHLRSAIMRSLDNLLTPPNSIMLFTEPNFRGRIVILPFGYLSGAGATAVFLDTDQEHALLFTEILKFSKPAGANTFSCIVPPKHKCIIGFKNDAPSLDLAEGSHATLIAPTAISNIQVTREI